jgi:gliding motility-associated-like protein
MIDIFFLAGRMTMLARRLFLPLRIIAVLSLLASTNVAAQLNCDCPKPTNCNLCFGDFTTIKLRYNGTQAHVRIKEGGVIRYDPPYTIGSQEIILSGSLSDETFSGPLDVYIVGLDLIELYYTTIKTTCGTEYPGSKHLTFEVVSITSKSGTVCCAPGTNDTSKPVISNCPSNKSVNLAGSCSTTVHWTLPTVTDNCINTVTWISSHDPDLTLFTAGTKTDVTYIAVDAYGNQSAPCTFSVTVNDIEVPKIICPGNITRTADAECQAKITLPSPSVTDCSSWTWKSSKTDDIFHLGSTPVTYTATDASGNKSSCTFYVIVEDKIKPVFVTCPADTSITATNSCTAKLKWPIPKATDNCSGLPPPTSSHDPDYAFPFGQTTVTYEAIDASGNSAKCSFVVTVNNPTDPTIEGCPGTIIANAKENNDSTIVTWDEPLATVMCGEVKAEKSHAPGSKFPIGVTPVTYTFTDVTGKSSICEFDVQVLEPNELFAISKVVTPDGDGINDVWELSNIENFKSNTVVVIDRWGNKIFQATGYDNVRTVWKGTNNSGTIVPTGTYFYTIEIRDQGKVVLKKGFIEVIQ